MTKGIVKKFIGISLLSTSMIYATASTKNETITAKETKLCLADCCMNTSKLQEEVEKRSQNGDLPFEMGLELIKRWSNGEITA